MIKKTILIASLFVVCIGISILINKIFFTPKIGFVNSTELVYGYDGMKEAHQEYQKREESWQKNLDTLRTDLENALKIYNDEYKSLSPKQRAEREGLLTIQKQQYEKYLSEISEYSKTEDSKMTQGVLNQINEFVQKYGKEHGYSMIFGTTNDGSLIYGEESKDLTKEILKAMNDEY